MYIGLDVGTTSVSVVLLDVKRSQIVAHHQVANRANRTPEPDAAEIDLGELELVVVEAIAGLMGKVQVEAATVDGIGITGQQHGVALLDRENRPLGPGITWQDRRAERQVPEREGSYLEQLIADAGGFDAFRSTGCRPAAGFMGTTLYRLQRIGELPSGKREARAVFIPDAIAGFLTGRWPETDPTLAASSGIFDIEKGVWSAELFERLKIPRSLLPPVVPAGSTLGGLQAELAARTGLREGTPVGVAMGDNQASFIGCVQQPDASMLVNVGTGGQLSVRVAQVYLIPGLEARPFPDGQYLLIGGGLFGGRSYAYLVNFINQIGQDFFERASTDSIYERLNELAAAVPPGSEGLLFEPFFTGSRVDPDLRASLTGLSPQNFTPGHFARALLEGMADGFAAYAKMMEPVIGERPVLVGSGNGIRRNRLLAQIIATRFGQDLRLPAFAEEAACGAALLSAVRQGAFASLDGAMGSLDYSDRVSSHALG